MKHAFIALAIVLSSPLLSSAASDTPDAKVASLAAPFMHADWSCSGKDVKGRRVRGNVGWTYADGTVLMFFAILSPSSVAQAHIDEDWLYDSDSKIFRTRPEPDAPEQVTYITGGWHSDKLVWARQAAQSTMAQRFTKPSRGKFTFAVTTQGNEAKSIGYALTCTKKTAP